jgi:protein O-mannosyl-transferase
MRSVILFGWLFVSFHAIAQDSARGLTIKSLGKDVQGTTRALIVGVSAYQNLPSLQYADKDAEEFAEFLTNNNAWHVEKSNIKLLTNEKAKAGDILSWLSWLLETSNKGDNIIFYFSGHGDVETNKDFNKGYLLAHDAPKNNYVAGGAIPIDILRQTYTEMIDKGIKLYMVTDACRAGHLAGGSSGAKISAEAFSKQWRNEIKILSAQPDELSYEGNQWGGGRGVFSFFLTKGLSGYADINKDSIITLAEIEQYVGLQVSQETGFKQQPVFEGASKYSNKLAVIDVSTMARYSQYRSGNITVAVLAEKGESKINAGNCTGIYDKFKTALAQLNDSATISTAVQSFEILSACDDEDLKNTGRFQLSASLMNYVQQIVNQTLVGKKLIGHDKLIEGLNTIDIIYQVNKNKRIVSRPHLENIRRYLVINDISFWDEEELTPAKQQFLISMLDSALLQEPGAAYLELSKGILFMNAEQYDSSFYYFKESIEHSPTWIMAYYYAAQALGYSGKYKEAVQYMETALALDSSYKNFECAKCFYNFLGTLYAFLEDTEKAEHYLLKAAEDEDFVEPVTALITLYHNKKQYKKRDQFIGRLKAESQSINDKLLLFELELELGLVNKNEGKKFLDNIEDSVTDENADLFYYVKGFWAESNNLYPVDYYRIAYESNLTNFGYIDVFVKSLCSNGEFEEAEEILSALPPRLKKTEQAQLDLYLAMCFAYTKRELESLEIFKRLISSGYMPCKELRDIKPLKKMKEYQAMIKACW